MEKRRLGRTEHHSSIVSFGAFSIGKLTQDEADVVIQMCLDYKLNHVDIAPGYANSMERLSPWMPEIKERMFIGCKTAKRTRDEAWRDIESIMTRMNIESFELFQLHAILDLDTLDRVTSKDGALQALIDMREQGISKWLGITGHGPHAPKTQLEALNRFDFDTVMFPVNASMYRSPQYRNDAERLIEACQDKDVGIQSNKMNARGGWGNRPRDCNTWYDPLRTQAEIDRALWWQLSQPIHTAPSCGEYKLLDKVLDSASRFKTLDSVQQEKVINSQNPPIPEPMLSIL